MNDFNFFSYYAKKEVLEKKSAKSTLPITLFLVISAGIGFLEWDYLSIKHVIEERIAEAMINNEQSSNKDIELRHSELTQQIAEQTLWLEEVSRLNKDMESAEFVNVSRVEEISALVPQEFFISAVTLNINTYFIQGTGESRTKIAEFEHNLNELDYIDNVFVSQISKQQEEELYSFVINCRLKEVVEID